MIGKARRSILEAELRELSDARDKTLGGAEQVLVFGSGTGKSSAMDHLFFDLRHLQPDVAAKVIGTVKIDAHHTAEGQSLAKVREFYAEFNAKG